MTDIPSECPRCANSRSGDDFYGICHACAVELRSLFSGESRSDVAAAEYEPKMNVTPNAIASKE